MHLPLIKEFREENHFVEKCTNTLLYQIYSIHNRVNKTPKYLTHIIGGLSNAIITHIMFSDEISNKRKHQTGTFLNRPTEK